MTPYPTGPGRRDAVFIILAALVVRLGVVAWAATSIPPTADGTFYHIFAERIAAGHGYTWLWGDGTVTYAAHFPVGYSAMLAIAYAAWGAKPVFAMLINTLFGVAAAWATYDLLLRAASRRLAVAGGLAVALHPALVPYTAALMTEGVTASLWVVAAALAARARAAESRRSELGYLASVGLVLGLATLVRPQSVALAPMFGALAVRHSKAPATRVVAALGTLAVVVFLCAPWTARNCVRMQTCALVSVNGGWNLAIGAQTEDGSWHEIVVPDACRGVFAEGAKDACFGDAAKAAIVAEPWKWLARIPAKLRVTFDYFGAAPWYLHASNPTRFPYSRKVALAAVEVVVSRLLLLASLVSVRKLDGPRRGLREAITAAGIIGAFLPSGAVIAYLSCAVAIVALGWRALSRMPLLIPAAALVILATAATHAVFFGAGRYGLVVVPFVSALAFVRAPRPSGSVT